MNEPKSSRYHRLRRRATGLETVLAAAILAGLLGAGGAIRLRELTGGSPAAFALLLGLLVEAAILPLAWYRTAVLEGQYGLSPVATGRWLLEHLKGAAVVIVAGAAAAGLLHACMRAWPRWWWLAAATVGAVGSAILTVAAPVLILPLFHRSRPLERPTLRPRLLDLSRRAGVPVLGVYEWRIGETSGRASASLAGGGSTRRILLSSSLLAGYTDDEIELVLAHEIGHHVHGDMLKGLAAEFAVLAGGFLSAEWMLGRSWQALGLAATFDPAGFPLVVLSVGAVGLLASPAVHALSRRSERRADRFALQMASRPDAFAGLVRRMAAQNMAEAHPTRMAVWLFHSHPPVEERIHAAERAGRRVGGGLVVDVQRNRRTAKGPADGAAIT